MKTSILVAGLGAILVSACAGSSSTPAAGPAPASTGASQASDACSLVAKADAEAALGEPAGAPRPRSSATTSACVYTSLSGAARLDVGIFHYPNLATATTEYGRFSNLQPIAGLGDQAGGNSGSVVVRKGSVLLTISMPVADKQPDPLGAMKTLAAKLVGRL